MKTSISLLLALTLLLAVTAPALAKPQTYEELQQMQQKLQKQMEEEMKKNPEAAKMIKQMGLDKQLSNANKAMKSSDVNINDYLGDIPKKDDKKIAKIPRKIMSDTELKSYLKQVQTKVNQKLSKQTKDNAEQIIKDIRAKYKTGTNMALSAAAHGCWMNKHKGEALYIIGILCNEDPSNADNLNSYAAFLTMSGAPEKAIPILLQLDNKYPNNSTVLNNVGQAFFDLGDTDEAEKYLNGAIKAFGHHSQANYAKAIIEESKGNKAEAIAALKRSLEHSYSKEKMDRLTKLGGQLDTKPEWGFHMPQDALGLDNFAHPPYPHSVGEVDAYAPLWKEFKKTCEAKLDALNKQAQPIHDKLYKKSMAQAQKYKNVKTATDLYNIKLDPTDVEERPPFYHKAMEKLKMMTDDGSEQRRKEEKFRQKYQQMEAEVAALQAQWEKESAPIEKAFNAQIGEGLPNLDEPYCSQLTTIADKYIGLINAKYEDYEVEYLDYTRKLCNNGAYYEQYTKGSDDEVELMKIQYKQRYLGVLLSMPVFLDNSSLPCERKPPTIKKSGKLADFYDLHCDHKISLIYPGIGSIKIECNKMTTDFNALPFLKAKWTDNLDTDKMINGEVLMGVSTGLGSKELGPLKAEAKIGGGMFMEFNSSGITDYGPYAELKGEVGVNWGEGRDPYEIHVSDTRSISMGDLPSVVEAGIEIRYGVNSGFKTEGLTTNVLSKAFD